MNPEDSQPAHTGRPPALDRGAGELVLIVDDVPDNLHLLHDALDEAGYTVLVATDGPSALARAQQAQPDIVLLDAMMPGMDGVEVCRQIRQNPATSEIAIIALTGRLDDILESAFKKAGATACLRKPLDINQLTQLLGL